MKSLLRSAVKLSAAAIPLGVLFACPAFADPPRYTIKDIFFPIPEDSGQNAAGLEINNAGQVAVGEEDGGFLYDDRDGSLTNMGFGFSATDINELGAVVGFNQEGFVVELHENGTTRTISEFEGTFPFALAGGINDAGEVTGSLDPPPEDFVLHPFLYSGGTIRLLDLSVDQGFCQEAEALDINNAGQIVGRIQMPTDSGCVFEAFLHDDGETLLIGNHLSDENTAATKINESGQIIVQISGAAAPPSNAYLYTDGDLQGIGDETTSARGLNNSGWIVGQTGGHAFLYIDGELHDLNDLVTDLTEWEHLISGHDINDSGQITGVGELRRADPSNRTRGAFLMTPLAADARIDIKPGGAKNRVNLRSKGLIGVAVLATKNFDATQVNWETVTFGPQEATEFHQRSHLRDVDEDGDMDYVAHFKIRKTGIRCRDTQATLSGETFDGLPFTGTGKIKVVQCR